MGEPTEKLYLDPTKKQDLTKAQGAMCLEYESTLVRKFKNHESCIQKKYKFSVVAFVADKVHGWNGSRHNYVM